MEDEQTGQVLGDDDPDGPDHSQFLTNDSAGGETGTAVVSQGGWADEPGLGASFEVSGCCCYVSGGEGGTYPVFGYDTNGDGITDAAAVDADGDGVAEQFYIDSNQDGVWDEIRDSAGNLIGYPEQVDATQSPVPPGQPQPGDGGVQAEPPQGYTEPQPVEPKIEDTELYPAPAGQNGQPQLVIAMPDGQQLSMPAVDADGDGVAETVAFDQNGDGTPDIWWADLTGNGVADAMVFDADGDGKPDTFSDPSENGQWTYVPSDEQAQPQPSGQPAGQPVAPAEPAAPAEQPATAEPAPSAVAGETGTGTGTFWEEHFPGEPFPTHSDPGMQLAMIIGRIEQVPNWQSDPELKEFHDQTKAVLEQWNAHQAAVVTPWLSEQAGDGTAEVAGGALPEVITDIVWSQTQSTDGFCVPVSVAMVVSEFRGLPEDQISEGEAVAAAIELGLIEQSADGTWTGMDAEGAARLLEHFQIPAHVESGTLDDLEGFIREGRSVLVAVDSDEVWEPGDDDVASDDAGADHALQVKEIIQERDASGQPTGDGVVVLFDPGHPDVPVREMTLQEFQDAWADGNNQMIVTDVAAERIGVDIDTSIPSDGTPAPPLAPVEPEPVSVTDVQQVPAEPITSKAASAAGEAESAAAPVLGEDASDKARAGERPESDLGREFDQGQQLRTGGALLGVAGAVLIPVYLHSRKSKQREQGA